MKANFKEVIQFEIIHYINFLLLKQLLQFSNAFIDVVPGRSTKLAT